MSTRRFSQVDVFSDEPFRGNPVAVVHDADGMTTEEMAAVANWTNLSETTFLLPPTREDADYRVRIFTPAAELPFAGHPTLGTARAWLEAGGSPQYLGRAGAGGDPVESVVQECGVGLVTVRVRGRQLAFAAPPLVRSGRVDEETLARVVTALGVSRDDVLKAAWIDNGPGWLGVVLPSAETVLGLQPSYDKMSGLEVGVIGAYSQSGPADYEVRAFCPDLAVPEDPVTGSLNAGFGMWLIESGYAPTSYTASQGTVLGRSGRVSVDYDGEHVWVGGAAIIRVAGTMSAALHSDEPH